MLDVFRAAFRSVSASVFHALFTAYHAVFCALLRLCCVFYVKRIFIWSRLTLNVGHSVRYFGMVI